MIGTFVSSDLLAVVVIALFLAATGAEYVNRRAARRVGAVAWGVFGVFWLNLIEHFAITKLSAIEGVLAAVAVPACLLTAYTFYTERRDFFLVTRAVTLMALLYFPVISITPVKHSLIEAVTYQVEFILRTLGYHPTVTQDDAGVRSAFVFITNNHRYVTEVLLACTGLGSISIVVGLVGAARAPLRKKAVAVGIAVPIIWGLNLIRVAFITIAHSKQWFRAGADLFALLGVTDEHAVSYLIADRIIAQSLSVVALILLTVMLVRVVPELGGLLNEVVQPVLGDDYDFTELYGDDAT